MRASHFLYRHLRERTLAPMTSFLVEQFTRQTVLLVIRRNRHIIKHLETITLTIATSRCRVANVAPPTRQPLPSPLSTFSKSAVHLTCAINFWARSLRFCGDVGIRAAISRAAQG